MQKTLTKKLINDLTYQIIGAAIEVHKILGPGLLEKNYEKALLHELHLRGLKTKSQQTIKVPYKGIILDCDLRYDILVEDLIVVENKAVIEMHPVFTATLLTYMEHLKVPKGILLNFHVPHLYKNGQKTYVNKYFSALPNFWGLITRLEHKEANVTLCETAYVSYVVKNYNHIRTQRRTTLEHIKANMTLCETAYVSYVVKN